MPFYVFLPLYFRNFTCTVVYNHQEPKVPGYNVRNRRSFYPQQGQTTSHDFQFEVVVTQVRTLRLILWSLSTRLFLTKPQHICGLRSAKNTGKMAANAPQAQVQNGHRTI